MSTIEHPLAPASKRYQRGTDRIVPPETTLVRVRPLLKVMGITRISNVTGLDRVGIPVVMVCRPNSRSGSVSQGKALDLVAAKVSGVMEAIETFHAEAITLPLRYASFQELCYSHPMIDVTRLPFSEQSLYRDDLSILWIEGVDLPSGRTLWLPLELVSSNYTLPLPPGSGCFNASTNGLASGNSLGEAVVHAICELIERDATTLWRLQGRARRGTTAVDPETIDDPDCRELLARFARAEIDVAIWDVTSDLGVPCFQCLAIGRGARAADPEFGAGCHLRPEVALSRALTEAAQARITFITGARDDLEPELYDEGIREQRRVACRSLLEDGRPARDFRRAPALATDTPEDDIEVLLDQLAGAGIAEVVMVDLTRPELKLPVARVVIPGLEGLYQPGEYRPGARGLAALDASGAG